MNTPSINSLPQCLSFTKVDVKTTNSNIHSSQLYGNSSGYFTDLVKNGYGQIQEQSHWCWVACAASIGSYYKEKDFGYRQETIYEMAKDLPLGTCNCPPRTYPNEDTCCNGTGWPSKALGAINAFAKEISGRAPDSSMLTELLQNRPMVMGVRFSYGHDVDGALGHAIVLSDAYNEGGGSFWKIFDPMFGIQIVNYSSFPVGYRGDPLAYWWFTDFTQMPC
ncbi:papain-like cysteine protease family protein [Serratia marcescens]|uniref:papain-like cysteine protease family protein n=1 Tax=Serratia marcescens TaxID=615 RepID=UPI000937FE2E|nr:papain-like cysteine protease family protein [Serratia marcescens]